jgi:hypothetical protein
MNTRWKALPAALLIGLAASLLTTPVLADDDDDDLDGRIESINRSNQSFVVRGIRVIVTPDTEFDDDYSRFSDLRVGHRVEIDGQRRGQRFIAREIERDDD